VAKLLQNLQTHKVTGPDGIPAHLLKVTANEAAVGLQLIFQAAILLIPLKSLRPIRDDSRPMGMGSCMLLATASSAVMSAVAHLATVEPSREWNTQNGGVRPPGFFTR